MTGNFISRAFHRIFGYKDRKNGRFGHSSTGISSTSEPKTVASVNDLFGRLTKGNLRRAALFGATGLTPQLLKKLADHNIQVEAVIESCPDNGDKVKQCGGYDVLPLDSLADITVDAIIVCEMNLNGQRMAQELLEMCFGDIPVFAVTPPAGLPSIKDEHSLYARSLYRRPLMDLGKKEHPVRVFMVPTFTDQEELIEEYWRLLWYLPQQEGIEVIFPTANELYNALPDADDFPRPEYFGQWSGARGHVAIFGVDGSLPPEGLEEADAAVVWNIGRLTKDYFHALNSLPNILLVDKNHKERRSGFSYSYLDYYVHPREALLELNKKSRQNLEKIAKKTSKLDNVYIFGTGPSLGRAEEFDFSDGIRIVCNTIVKNDKLLDHIRPHLIVAADADYHFGCALYASQFRTDLVKALKKTGAMLVCPEVFVPLILHHHRELADRIIGIPVVNSRPNLDLSKKFWLSAKDNVLVLFLIPLAASLGKRIHMMGFDGKRPGEEKFWGYDPSSQYLKLMKSIELCHPAFFQDRDYSHYFERHCKLIEDIIDCGERIGKEFISLTDSVIPALASRSIKSKG